LFGIDVYVHGTFLLLLVFFIVYGHVQGGIGGAVDAAVFIVGVFTCVVLHEYGHALVARRFGIPTLDITLYPIGGVARLARLGENPMEEFCIAVAGPAVNVAIAAVLGTVLAVAGRLPASVADLAQLAQGDALGRLLKANLILVAFNMLPAFPMDGGRVLRSLLTPQVGRLRATEMAARLGTLFAIVFAVVGISVLPSPMLVLIGGFTFIAGRQELAMVRWIERNRRLEPLMVLPVDDHILDVAPAPMDPGFSGVIWDERTGAWTIWRNGRPVQAQGGHS
jgi:Zn-dependent protease